MLQIITDTEGFMDIDCTGPDSCDVKFHGVGPLWGADIIGTHDHGPANGTDHQRLAARVARHRFDVAAREAAAAAKATEAHEKFWAARR